MSNYSIVTNFLAKDSLISGNPAKAVKGADLTTEYTAVQTALNSKVDGAVVYFPDGNATQPSVGFTNNAGTGVFNNAGVLGFATSGVLRYSVTTTGAQVIAAPTSGIPLTINGVVATAVLQLKPADSASIGLQILDPGANATQVRLSTTNSQVTFQALGTSTSFVFQTSGGVTFTCDPSQGIFTTGATGSGQGAGTINAQGLYVNGNQVFAGIPQNIQATNYTFVLADANKHIYQNAVSTHTYTIPANSSVAFPIGTAITIINGNGAGNMTLNITTDTLIWSPSGTLGGGRTIAANGVATLIKVTATAWYLTGSGIS